jgi:protein-L-isoaspartate(D-aspartate) O-methyltransferase
MPSAPLTEPADSPLPCTWQQANAAFPDRASAERIFATEVRPILLDAEAERLITSWFFIRKQQWRLRWLPVGPPPADAFRGRLATAIPAVTWTSVVCELEPLAFGGDAGMAAACELFHADSRHLLHWLASSRRPVGQRETSVLLSSTLLRAAGLDWFEQGDVWAKVAVLRPHPPIPAERGEAHDLRQAMRTLMTADTLALSGPGQPLSDYKDWLSAFGRAGQIIARLHGDGHLTRGLRAVLAHHLIFHFNRAGLTGTDQATMAALARGAVFHDDQHGYSGRADQWPRLTLPGWHR